MKTSRGNYILASLLLLTLMASFGGCSRRGGEEKEKGEPSARSVIRKVSDYLGGRAAAVSKRPLPAGPNVRTERDFRKSLLKWNRRILVESHKRVGIRDKRWDELALKYLEMDVQYFCGGPRAPELEELTAAGKAVIDAGCKDPLISYCYGAALHEGRKSVEAAPFIRRAIEGLEKVKYPWGIARCAPRRLAIIYSEIGEKERGDLSYWRARAIDGIGESARDGSYQTGEQRIFWRQIAAERRGGLRVTMTEICDAVMAKPGADPWIVNMVSGECQIDEAWKARGSGWASTVKTEGWKGFEDHLKKARKFLAKAWRLHPDYPEAPARMITVTTGLPVPGETKRLWFDRAVAGQLDYADAYRIFLWALRPRWGGGHREMYNFGLECLSTKRFDTDVPSKFFDAVWDISAELPNWRDAYRKPKVYRDLSKLCNGMKAEPIRAEQRTWWSTLHAVLAWCCGEYDDARRMLDELGDEIQPSAFEGFKETKERIIGEVFAATGPFAATVRRAENLRLKRKSSEALSLFNEVLDGTKKDKRARPYLRDRVAALRIENDLDNRRWADLMPEADMAGWSILAGEWTLDADGALKAVSCKSGMMLICKSRVGRNFEIRGEVEFVSNPKVNFQAGVILGYREGVEPTWTSFRVYQHSSDISLGKGFLKSRLRKRASFRERNSFRIQSRNSHVTVNFNGRRVYSDYQMQHDFFASEGGRIGLGALYTHAGAVLKYRRLRIHRL